MRALIKTQPKIYSKPANTFRVKTTSCQHIFFYKYYEMKYRQKALQHKLNYNEKLNHTQKIKKIKG